eukprot:gene30098-39967_t
MLRIEVCDSGRGFAAEEQEQVAADLLRFHGRDLKGTGCSMVGLGLCIARGIAKLHQGSFDLHSAGIEHGRRIVAELPLYSHPTTPLPDRDHVRFESIFRALEAQCDQEEEKEDGCPGNGAEESRAADVLSSSNAPGSEEEEDKEERGRVGMVEVVGSFPIQKSPVSEDLSGPVRDAAPQREDLAASHCPAPHSHTSAPSSALRHGQGVYPDTAAMIDPSNVGDVQVEPSPERAVEVACPSHAGASRKSLDGLRFLIVVSLPIPSHPILSHPWPSLQVL